MSDEFLPNDGSLVLMELDLAAVGEEDDDARVLGVTWLGGIFGLHVYGPDLFMRPAIVLQRQFSSTGPGDPPPVGWQPIESGPPPYPTPEGGLGFPVSLAFAYFPEGETTSAVDLQWLRWRFALCPPPEGMSAMVWQNFHVRFVMVNNSNGILSEEAPDEYWLKGPFADPETILAEDPETWPGTDWVTESPLSVGTPTEEHPERYHNRYIRVIYPNVEDMATRPYLANPIWPGSSVGHAPVTYCPGVIPGKATPANRYRWPKRDGKRVLRKVP